MPGTAVATLGLVHRRARIIAAALAVGGSVAATTGSGGAAPSAGAADPKGALSCVPALDASAIDRVLGAAGSPLAGQGATIVTAAAASGLDPRILVAIAGHETVLLTYAPAAAIHNPFGLGPHMRFADDEGAINYAARLLGADYVAQGRTTIATISGKWAPIGAANDPTGLNANWVAGVSTLYARLGGDPDAPVTLATQIDRGCSVGPARATSAPDAVVATTAPGQPAPGVRAWNGAPPSITAPTMDAGADPTSGQPATIAGFVFPLVPGATPPIVVDDFAAPGEPGCYGANVRCSVSIVSAVGTPVVAAAGGVVVAATAAERSEGIAFWIVAADGDRIGYSGLTSYAPGIHDTAGVAAGQLLGASTERLRLAWERQERRINAAPLLRASL